MKYDYARVIQVQNTRKLQVSRMNMKQNAPTSSSRGSAAEADGVLHSGRRSHRGKMPRELDQAAGASARAACCSRRACLAISVRSRLI